MPQFHEQLVEALGGGQPFALGLISGIKGSSPQKQGAKALFFADGRIVGTLGGGCLEAEIQDRARRALLTGQAATFDLLLDHDFGWDDGLICGGRVSGLILPRAADAASLWRELIRRERPRTWGVRRDFSIGWADDDASVSVSDTDTDTDTESWRYRETVFPPCPLWIAGSGHVAQAVAPLGVQLDFDVTVFDDRPTFASADYFPGRVKYRIGAWDEILGDTLPERASFGLIVTRGHQRDALVLADWIHRSFIFLGMIGSRRKARLIFDQFRDEKLATDEEMARVVCPVGLDIQSKSVPEIAVSIMAQFIQKRAEALNTPVKTAVRP